jgi:Tol biopolymer transport system component
MPRLLANLGLLLVGWLLVAPPAHATFPGENGKLAFTVFLGDSYSQFDVMNSDGGNVTRLTNFCCGQNTSPTWSPDGTKIAFETSSYGGYDIAVMNADGTGVTKLTNTSGVNLDPAWSPDGSKIAFSRADPMGDPNNPSYGAANIAVMNADGTGLTRLTDNPRLTYDFQPAWSPDGTKIAFSRQEILGAGNIYIMDADGTGVTRLTNVTQRASWDTEPDWSPDGSKIVFFQNGGIWIMNPDGTAQTQLTSDAQSPTWSPDGTKIAFLSSGSIFTMNPNGSEATFLGGSGATDFDWQPLPAAAPKNRAKACKALGKRERELGRCISKRP